MNKLKTLAVKAKSAGFLYVASVVKSVFKTTYYHVVKIDDVINSGKWPTAPWVTFPGGAWRMAGQSTLPDNTIMRRDLYNNQEA